MLNSIPIEIQQQLIKKLNSPLQSFSFSAGGCINNGGRLSTESGDFFIKWNDREKFPAMFDAEAKGLALLSETKTVFIPAVIHSGETAAYQYLVLEFIEQKSKRGDYWELLGEQLAAMHRITSPAFGLDHDNFIGSLPQCNTLSSNWSDFFIHHRLKPQLQLAIQRGALETKVADKFEALFKMIPALLPNERPSLLHGDLWNGNLISNALGEPCLIDPAVYYGSREAEIAFTTLFGGFSDRFYASYNAAFPIISGYDERADLYNLYPLLVHVNLFGGAYVAQVVSIVRTFV
jgi:protein-ribulosamine 3-kinase